MRATGVMDALAQGGGAAERSRAIDWSELGEGAVALLRQYLRIATPNDPSALSAEASETRPWEAGCEVDAAASRHDSCAQQHTRDDRGGWTRATQRSVYAAADRD